jgi:hypothetical protein
LAIVLNGITPTGLKPPADAMGRVSAEPSWGQVLATTVKLRVQRLHPAGSVSIPGACTG